MDRGDCRDCIHSSPEETVHRDCIHSSPEETVHRDCLHSSPEETVHRDLSSFIPRGDCAQRLSSFIPTRLPGFHTLSMPFHRSSLSDAFTITLDNVHSFRSASQPTFFFLPWKARTLAGTQQKQLLCSYIVIMVYVGCGGGGGGGGGRP